MSEGAFSVAIKQQLPREVLKWLQGLDLAFAIKNTRRDFTNGFLVAEILSRYFPEQVQLHSFDNGLAQTKRKDNWRQLLVLFRKIKFEIPQLQTITFSVMNSEPTAAIKLISSLYTFLTTRKIRTEVAPKLLSTSSHHSSQSSSQNSKAMPRDQSQPSEDAEVLSTGMLKLEASSESSSLRMPSKVLRGENRTVGPGETSAHVKAGGVSIKSVDADVMRLRTERQYGQAIPQQSFSDESKDSDTSVRRDLQEQKTASRSGQDGPKSSDSDSPFGLVEKVLEEAVHPKAGFTINSLISELTTMRTIAETMLSKKELSRLLQHLVECTDQMATCALAAPSEWALLIVALGNLVSVIRLPLAARLLGDVGEAMAEINPVLTRSLFFDYVLEAVRPCFFAPLLLDRASAMAIFAAYCPLRYTANQRACEVLAQHLGDARVAILCFIAMHRTLGSEIRVSWRDPLCMYYVRLARANLKHSSPHTRSAALCLLAYVIEHHILQPSRSEEKEHDLEEGKRFEGKEEEFTVHSIVFSLLLELLPLAEDSWWEVPAQVALLVSFILQREDFADSETQELAINLLLRCLQNARNVSVNAKLLCCVSAAKCLNEHHDLISPWISCYVELFDAQSRKEVFWGSSDSGGEENATVSIAASSQVFEGTRLAPASKSIDGLIVLEHLASGACALSSSLSEGEIHLLENLYEALPATAVPASQVSKNIFNRLAPAIFHALQHCTNAPSCFPRLCDLLFLTLLDRHGVNVLLHPHWPDTIFRVVGTASRPLDGDEKTSPAAERAAVLLGHLRTARKHPDPERSATLRALVADTLAKYPRLETVQGFATLG